MASEAQSAVDFILGDQRAAAQDTFAAFDSEPADAARAVELGTATGVPAPVVHANLEQFEKQTKSAMTAQLLNSSAYLSNYINSDPMAAKISHNDLPQLDSASEWISKIPTPQQPKLVANLLEFGAEKVIPAAWHGLLEGFGNRPIGGWVPMDFRDRYPVSADLYTLLGYPIEVPFRLLSGIVKGTADATYEATKEGYFQLTGDKSGSERFARDMAAIVEAEGQGATGRGHMGKPHMAAATKAVQELQAVKTWIEHGEEPPPGISPYLDKLRGEQSKRELKDFDEAYKESQKTETRELSPETYRRFVDMHTQGSVSVKGEAIAKLYGDKKPLVDDGLFGFDEKMAEKLETAIVTGGDVEIPIADWLAKVEPDTHKALKDDIRIRPNGFSINEMKEVSERKADVEGEPQGPVSEPLPQVRSATAIEPMFSIGDRKVKLERITQDEKKRFGPGDPAAGFHDFEIQDHNNVAIGSINISEQRDGKVLYVDMIRAGGNATRYDPNFLGPRLILDIGRQLADEFPNASTVTGHRVSGAREKAGTWEEKHAMPVINLDKLRGRNQFDIEGWAQVEPMRELLNGHWEERAMGIQAYIKPLNGKEQDIVRAIKAEVERIIPKQVDTEIVSSLWREGKGNDIGGVYTQFSDAMPRILIALDSAGDPVGVARHEAIHHLRSYGFFKEAEWATLERAAKDGGWLEQYGIDKRYGKLEGGQKLEEAIADAFRYWRDGGKVSAEAATIFEKLKAFFESIRQKVAEVLGREPKWEEIFQKVDEGEVGGREGTTPLHPEAYRESVDQFRRGANENKEGDWRTEQDKLKRDLNKLGDEIKDKTPIESKLSVNEPELPGTTRMEDRQPFTPGAMSPTMTADMQRRYMKLIEDRNKEDLAAAFDRAERFQKAQQTAAWKSDREAMRADVEREINNRPDVAADLFFSRGELYGERLGAKPKVSPEGMPKELLERVPEEWLSDRGMNADDAANLFGFRNAADMFDSLADYQAGRPEGIGAKRFRDQIVEKETDRQMELRYGRLQDNIIEDAKDQAISETQLNILHEETLHLAEMAGSEFPITKAEMKRWVGEKFGEANFKDTTRDKYLMAAGRVGRTAEEALLKEKYQEAFVAKQQQYMAMEFARQAKTLDKERAQFDKTVKKFAKREVKNVEKEFTDFAQELLIKSGLPSRVSLEEVQASKNFFGNNSLQSFVESKDAMGWDLGEAIADYLQRDESVNIKDATVNQFRDLKDAVDALEHVGRRTMQIEIAGAKADFDAFRKEVVGNITQLPARDKNHPVRWFYQYDAMQTRTEQMIKDLDLRQEMGPLFRAVIEPMVKAKAKEFDLMSDLTKKLRAMDSATPAWQKTLNDVIPNDFFFDPYDGALFNMNRSNLVQVMLNWGNRGNIDKFAKGYGSPEFGRVATKDEAAKFEAKINQMISDHATPADWAYVRGIWDIFQGWQGEIDTVHRNTSGKTPRWVTPEKIRMPDGRELEGGYYPIIYDRVRPVLGTAPEAKPAITNGILKPDYYRAGTSKSYMKERTGYADRIQFTSSIEEVGMRMQQVMHDIAFREGMIDVGKVLYDKQIRGAMRKHYGAEYEAQMIPWLEKIANHFNQDEIATAGANAILQRARTNLVAHALPFNLKVILSPSTGVLNPVDAAQWLWNRKEMTANAMAHSKEIPHTEYNIDRDFRESLERTITKKGWQGWQADAAKFGYKPVIALEQALRTMTFDKKFREGKAKGLSDTDSASVADSFVRERHGAQSVVDLPAIMNSSEAMKVNTMFYGFFNTMYNWQRQLPGQVRRGEWNEGLKTLYGAVLAPAAFGALLFNQRKEDDSWGKTIAKALAIQPLSTLVFARDIANFMFEGYQSRTPVSTVTQAGGAAIADIRKYMDRKPIDKGVQHTANVVGLGLGVPGMAQAGRTGQFLYDVSRGRQQPKTMTEWMRGVIQGESKLKK